MLFSFKQFCIYLALSLCLLAGLSNCSDRQADADGVEIRTPEDLNKPEMIIGGETGTISLYIAKDKLPRAQYLEYFDLTDLCEALVRVR